MKHTKSTTFYCFSPPVMMATFLIEIALMVWVLIRYRQTLVVKLVALMMFALAIFQFAEYNVCEGAMGIDSVAWARVGFVAITALPALGIHIIAVISKRSMRWLVWASYGAMAVFMAIYALSLHGVTSSVCGGNYVIFYTMPSVVMWYALYYYGLELIALAVIVWLLRRNADGYIHKALCGMAAAYLVLLVPTTTVNVLSPQTIAGIPSIMCGFAVFTALIVSLYVLPNAQKQKHS